ncbi:MAG TPA: ring-cleaving dioxygenase [Bryobacteraceae bacterium]|jgi:glyoxalase family protein|nr:ring-cleaving dioxygenase [Bryobacteraceae bacterium]
MNLILGVHHITAIAGDAQQNIDFYTGVLGLRLVKITVNFDDPEAYHLYYGDGHGRPGTILTFFAWPGARRGRQGNGQVTAASFAVPKGSLEFWTDRLAAHGIAFEKPPERFGQPVLSFADSDGMRLELIETPLANALHIWGGGGIPAAFAIHGFHGATLSETGYERTAVLLTETMGFRLLGQEQNRFRFEPCQAHAGEAGRTIDVICAPAAVEGRVAVGTIHHIAFRTPNDAQQRQWLAKITGLNYNVSPVMDRVYFHSIYYREPGGILFEIATDCPGFATDEPVDKLGETLKLPPWLEAQRPKIEASLPPIHPLKRAAP